MHLGTYQAWSSVEIIMAMALFASVLMAISDEPQQRGWTMRRVAPRDRLLP